VWCSDDGVEASITSMLLVLIFERLLGSYG
jgi:hypothetical protein